MMSRPTRFWPSGWRSRSAALRMDSPRAIQAGAALIELALVLPLLLLLALGTVEIGQAIYQYKTVVSQVRAGARYIGQKGLSPTDKANAICLVKTGTLSTGGTACDGQPLLPGLGTAQITISTSREVLVPISGSTLLVPIHFVDVTVSGFTYQMISGPFLGAVGLAPDGTFPFGPITTSMQVR